MGAMKSLQPHKDMPFDVGGFIGGLHSKQDMNLGVPQPPDQPDRQEKGHRAQ
jgi:hypothetical protein